MQRRTVTGPATFGTLSLVFGILVACGVALGECGVGVISFAAKASHEAPDETTRALVEGLADLYTGAAMQTMMLSYLVMSVWLIVIGVGQRRYRAWARTHSIAWGAVALGVILLVDVLMLVGFMPAYMELLETAMRHQSDLPAMTFPPALMGVLTIVSSVLFYAPYPVILLVYFTRPKVKQAMID